MVKQIPLFISGTKTCCSLSSLPHDPSTFRISNSDVLITFSRFRARNLATQDVYAVLLAAAVQVNEEIRMRGDVIISPTQPPTVVLQYRANHVLLTMFPSSLCTWGRWGVVIRGIKDFVQLYEFKQVHFDLHEAFIGLSFGGGDILFAY